METPGAGNTGPGKFSTIIILKNLTSPFLPAFRGPFPWKLEQKLLVGEEVKSGHSPWLAVTSVGQSSGKEGGPRMVGRAPHPWSDWETAPPCTPGVMQLPQEGGGGSGASPWSLRALIPFVILA